MRLIGDLVFVGLGQAKGLRVENLAADPSTPSAGQIWYNTTDGVYRGFDGTSVHTFAVGGNTSLLQNEIDTIESSAGLGTDGSYTAPGGNNYLSTADNLNEADSLLDAQIKVNSDAITTINGDISTINTTLGDHLTEINAIEAGAGLNADGTFTAPAGTNYISAGTSLKAIDVLLDTQVKTNADDILTKLNLAGGTMTGNIVMTTGTHVTLPDAPVNATDAVNLAYVQANLAGLSWKNSVKAMSDTNLTLSGAQTVDGVSLVAGDRVLVNGQTTASANGIYVVVDGGAWTRATDFDSTTPINEINAGAVWVEGGTSFGNTGWTQTNNVTVLDTDAISFTQFNGAAGITAGVGLGKAGNTLNVLLGAGIQQLPTDEVGVDLYASSGLFLTEDGSAASGSTDAKLSILLDGSTLAKSATGLKVASAGVSEVELAASVAGNGLTGGAGAALAVGAGTGITVAADAVSFDETYGDGRYINTAGDTMTGDLILNADPTNVLGAVTKQYADTINTRLTNSYFEYNGSTPAVSHTVTHNIGKKFCNVTVVDANDKVIIPDVITFDSTTQLTVEFASSIACRVVVMAAA